MKTKNALERYREASKLSFAEMARLAGLSSRSAVFQHCNGVRNISAESALRYSRAFGIPLSELRPDLWPPEPPAWHDTSSAELGESLGEA